MMPWLVPPPPKLDTPDDLYRRRGSKQFQAAARKAETETAATVVPHTNPYHMPYDRSYDRSNRAHPCAMHWKIGIIRGKKVTGRGSRVLLIPGSVITSENG